MTTEQLTLLAKFQEQFDLRAYSTCGQDVSFDEKGVAHYGEPEPFDETDEIEVYHKGNYSTNLVTRFGDAEEVILFAESWRDAGYPMPDDDSDFWNNQ